jgi:hypothetical protein
MFVYVSESDARDGIDRNSTVPQPSLPGIAAPYQQQVAAHSLEALSTAAADRPSYPPQNTAYYTQPPPANGNPEYGFITTDQVNNGTGSSANNLGFILNPTQQRIPSSVIDPNLEASVGADAGTAPGAETSILEKHVEEGTRDEAIQEQDDASMPDDRIASTLRMFNENQS